MKKYNQIKVSKKISTRASYETYVQIFGSIGISLFVGWLGSLFTQLSLAPWYDSLRKPVGTPPQWVFAPVWIVLYICMGYAYFLVSLHAKSRKRIFEIRLIYYLQLLCTLLWSVVFFGLRLPGPAFVVLLSLWGLVVFMVKIFLSEVLLSGVILIPYILWLSLAVWLNIGIIVLN